MLIRLVNAQERDPCGFPDRSTLLYKRAAAIGWGYGYDTLRHDLEQWEKSPFANVDSIGATVQNRAIFMVTIQDSAVPAHPRTRIWIHARTHPCEVQGTWVTNEIITQLLSNTPTAKQLRDSCVFNIVPMYNPDGVELGLARENANTTDLESNWNTYPGQPEVIALRSVFTDLMTGENPIRIALNMHAAYGQSRYFVYHAETGTSPLYSSMEIRFIDTVRSNFPGGIEPYTHFISWTSPAPLHYPESWFWYNHRENVLALTYEDMNDPSAHAFDKTAEALLRGIGDYLGVLRGAITSVASPHQKQFNTTVLNCFRNPSNSLATVAFSLQNVERVTLGVFDPRGRAIAVLVDGIAASGEHRVQWNTSSLSRGSYVVSLRTGSVVRSRLFAVVK